MTTGTTKGQLAYRVLYKKESTGGWYEFIKYETKEECISYIENINPLERPALIVFGQQTLRAYDSGIIDYEYIGKLEQENQELKDNLWEVRLKPTIERNSP